MKLNRIITHRTNGEDIRWVQLNLKDYNFYNGNIDGFYNSDLLQSVKKFQKYFGLKDDGVIEIKTWNAIKNFKKPDKNDIPYDISYLSQSGLKIYNKLTTEDNYYKEETVKDIIWIKSTNSTYRPDIFIDNISNFYKLEKNGKPAIDRMGNLIKLKNSFSYVIGGRSKEDKLWDGKILKAFEDKYWSYFINDENLSKRSIVIQVCNYGHLNKIGDSFYNKNGILVDEIDVVECEYKNYKYWHRYTDNQINSLYNLILFLKKTWKIDIKKYDDWLYDKKINVDNGGLMTDLNWDGIGLFPQKEIIDILNKI